MAEPLLCRLPRPTVLSAQHKLNNLLPRPLVQPRGTQNRKPTALPLDRRRSITSYGYTQAKALVYSSYGEPKDVLSLHSHSISPPSGTELTLRTLASPINPADINQIQGVYPSKPPFTSDLGTSKPSAVGGNEACAEVLSTGSKVTGLQKGDWVIMKSTGMGTWRTHLSLSESQVLKIENREGLTPLQVGTVSVNPCTAYRMLLDFTAWTFRGDEWFVQNGANSGVGRAAIQLGHEWGLKSINVVRDRDDPAELDKLKAELQDLGATHVVTESELNARGFRDQVKEWTRGGREEVRLALNCVNGPAATAFAKLLSPSSATGQPTAMLTYGAMSKQPLSLPASLLIFRDTIYRGFWVSSWSDRHPEQKKQTVDDVLRLTREGKFKDIPVHEVKWDWNTGADTLTEAVQRGLEGKRGAKGVFVFGET